MNQKHQRDYYWLTNLLLTCPSKKLEILQANPDLLDAELVRSMLEVAEVCEQRGDRNSANWLRDLATQIAIGMGSSLPNLLKAAEADKLLQKGTDLQRTSQFKPSLQFLQPALSIYREIGNRQGEGTALNVLGNACDFFGHYQEAIELYHQALLIVRDTKNLGGEVCCLGNLGKTYCNKGDYQRAVDHHQQALNIAESAAQKTDIYHPAHHAAATALGGLGTSFYALGQYKKAIDYHQKQLGLSRKISNRIEEVNALGGLGLVFYFIGQVQKAIDYYQKSLTISRGISARAEEASILSNLGAAYNSLRENDKAVECFQKSLDIQKEQGHRFGEASTQSGLGMIYRSIGHYPQATECYQQALEIAKEIGDRSGEANYLTNLGIICNLLGKYQQAIDYYNQASTITEEIRDLRGKAFALSNLGQALLNFGHLTQSENILRAAVEVKESLRIGLKDAHKVSIFDTQMDTYSLLQQAIVLQHRPNEALEVSERGRARAFAELLHDRFIANSENLASLSDEKEFLVSPALEQIQKIAEVQKITIVEYSIINSDHLFIWVINPAGEITFCPVYLEPLRRQNTSLVGLVADTRRCLDFEKEPRDPILATSDATSSLTENVFQPLQQLYEYLIQPISHLLPLDPSVPVVFIPHGDLFLVPFTALQDLAGRFLIEKYTILTAPSIQVLDLTFRQRKEVEKQGWKDNEKIDALVVGNPSMPIMPLTDPPKQLRKLPAAAVEATVIASSFNTQPILGAAATKANVVKQAPKARLIHLATHGLLDDIRQLGVPGAIALSPSGEDNGFLTAGEILELRLNAELVILSACVTGLGKITGDGVIGLSRCLMAAGVSRIVVTLCSVNDLSTAFLMIKFHENLKSASEFEAGGVANALNQAQRWLLSLTNDDARQELKKLEPYVYQAYAGKQKVAETYIKCWEKELQELHKSNPKPFANPFYWSAFVAIGL